MYDLEEIRRNALGLMDELGRSHLGQPLQSSGWTFRFDRAKRRMGACRWEKHGNKIISLSRHYSLSEGWGVMEDVLRHEIAHALEFETRGSSDHGRIWKQWALRCGADPSRLYEAEDIKEPEGRYIGRCPHCGGEREFYRMPKRAYACRTCCDRFSRGQFSYRFRLEVYERATGRKVELLSRELLSREAAAGQKRNARQKRKMPKYTGTCPQCGAQVGFARKLKRRYACRRCCRKYAGGQFSARFEYVIRQNY